MEAEASVRQKKNELRSAEMEADITLEERRKSLVAYSGRTDHPFCFLLTTAAENV
jgi:hypothetical protein